MRDWQPDFLLGVGDDKVPMDYPITDQFGNPVDLTGASVQLSWGPLNHGTPPTVAAGSVTGTTPGTQARYLWLAADTVTAGNFEASFLITLPSTERFSWPQITRGYPLQIQIGPSPA